MLSCHCWLGNLKVVWAGGRKHRRSSPKAGASHVLHCPRWSPWGSVWKRQKGQVICLCLATYSVEEPALNLSLWDSEAHVCPHPLGGSSLDTRTVIRATSLRAMHLPVQESWCFSTNHKVWAAAIQILSLTEKKNSGGVNVRIEESGDRRLEADIGSFFPSFHQGLCRRPGANRKANDPWVGVAQPNSQILGTQVINTERE